MPFDPALFDEIDAALDALSIDEIAQRLNPVMIGFQLQTPIFDPGTFLYRARQLGGQFRKEGGIKLADLIYPPAAISKLGRVNRPGQPLFYAGMQKEGPFFELPHLANGDELILTFWKTTDRMIVNNVGYTEFVFETLGAKRPVPHWRPPEANPQNPTQVLPIATLPKEAVEKAMSADDASELKSIFSRYFTRCVGPDETSRYKLTTAIGEIHLGEIHGGKARFAGILYPSVRMWANGDNLALQPWFVDDHLLFRKAVHVRIKEKHETAISIDYLDVAHGFDAVGNLEWLGRLKTWTLGPGQAGQMTLTAGKDDDGDYYISKDGQPAHWVLTDQATGAVIDPE